VTTLIALETIINAGTLVACTFLWRELASRQRPRRAASTTARAARPVPSGSGY
jgi:hypothetical protein